MLIIVEKKFSLQVARAFYICQILVLEECLHLLQLVATEWWLLPSSFPLFSMSLFISAFVKKRHFEQLRAPTTFGKFYLLNWNIISTRNNITTRTLLGTFSLCVQEIRIWIDKRTVLSLTDIFFDSNTSVGKKRKKRANFFITLNINLFFTMSIDRE